jgi:hypothetical protein
MFWRLRQTQVWIILSPAIINCALDEFEGVRLVTPLQFLNILESAENPSN